MADAVRKPPLKSRIPVPLHDSSRRF